MHYSRKHILSIGVALLGVCNFLLASDTLSWAKVEQTTYNLYVQKDWKQLAKFGETAVAKGYDYYYLRVRTAVAFFEMKQYRKALGHFEKAAYFDNNDFVNEYLYYCYIYTERFDQARALANSFDPNLRAAIKLSRNTVRSIGLESGMKFTSDKLFNTGYFNQVNLSHTVSKSASVFHAFTFYMQDEWRFNVKQYQYYIQLKKPLNHNFTLLGAVHFIAGNVSIYDTTITDHPGPPPKPPTKTPFTTTLSSLSIIASLSLVKHTSLFDYALGATILIPDSTKQYQLNAGITYYPLKNNRLSINANLYAHSNDKFNAVYFAIAPSVNYYFSKRAGISVAYFLNNGANITEANGYLVNNSIDLTTSRLSSTLYAPLTKKISVYATYAYENKQDMINLHTYNYNIAIAGIRVVF